MAKAYRMQNMFNFKSKIMKKVCILLVLTLCCGIVQSQNNCKVQGVVRYYYNDIFKYKADLGAEIRFIPKTKQDTIPSCDKWNEYETKSCNVVRYLKSVAEFKESGAFYMMDNTEEWLRENYNVSKSDENRVEQLSNELFDEVVALLKDDRYMCVVDNSGMYNIELPYGEYYVVMKSANRNRPFMVDFLGRIYVLEVKLTSSTKVISHDFEL